MKRFISILSALIIAISAIPLSAAPVSAAEKDTDILVAYFSCTGNTEKIAKHIADALGADSYKITPKIPYTSADLDYNTDCRANREQNDSKARPEISGSVDNMGDYSVVFIGYPIWWGQAPKIMYTFLESYDFSGKTIVPFCTSGSSGIGSSAANMQPLTSGASWLDGKRFSGSDSKNTVKSWVDTLSLPEKHEHNFGAEWRYDETSHWHECECGEKNSLEEHTPNIPAATESEDKVCTVCGYIMEKAGVHEHSFGADWRSDESGHWHECNCGEKTAIEEHTPNIPAATEGGDKVCTVCGYVIEKAVSVPIYTVNGEPADSWQQAVGLANNGQLDYVITVNKEENIKKLTMPKKGSFKTLTVSGSKLSFSGNISLTGDTIFKDIELCALDINDRPVKFSISAGRNALTLDSVTVGAADSKITASGALTVKDSSLNAAVTAGTLEIIGSNRFGGSVSAKKIISDNAEIEFVKTAEKSDKNKLTIGAEGIEGNIAMKLVSSFGGEKTAVTSPLEFGAWNVKTSYNGCISVINEGIEAVQSGKKLYAAPSEGLYALSYNDVSVKYISMKDLSAAVANNAKDKAYTEAIYTVTLPAKDEAGGNFTLPAAGKYGKLVFTSESASEIKISGDIKLTGSAAFNEGITFAKDKNPINLTVSGKNAEVIFEGDVFGGKLGNISSSEKTASIEFRTDITASGKVNVKGKLIGKTFTLTAAKGAFAVGSLSAEKLEYALATGANVKLDNVILPDSGKLAIEFTDESPLMNGKTVLIGKIGITSGTAFTAYSQDELDENVAMTAKGEAVSGYIGRNGKVTFAG